jgi:hypothetical protein
MLTSREGYRGQSNIAVVVYKHTDEYGNTRWTARNDRNKASKPSITESAKDSALTALLQELDVSRSDVDDILFINDVSDYEKIIMRRCDQDVDEINEGWFIREPKDKLGSVKFGSIGEATLLSLDEAYRLKEKYPSYDFDFKKGEK